MNFIFVEQGYQLSNHMKQEHIWVTSKQTQVNRNI